MNVQVFAPFLDRTLLSIWQSIRADQVTLVTIEFEKKLHSQSF